MNADMDMSKYDGLLWKTAALYCIFIGAIIVSLAYYEGSQGALVYMSVISSHFSSIPRLVPKPFTSSLVLVGKERQA